MGWPERWGVMFYPPDNPLVDESAEWHLARFPLDMPFNLTIAHGRSVERSEEVGGTGAARRPFAPDTLSPEARG